jgi:hypothetical protein
VEDAELLVNYTTLAESTGESFESIANRVEAVGATALAAVLRAQAKTPTTQAPEKRRSSATEETV